MSRGEFADRVAFVTGAGTGIGRATAEALASRGAKVAFVTRSDGNRLEAEACLGAMGAEVLAIKGDVAVPGDVSAAVEQVRERFGRIDFVVANAATVGQGTNAVDTTLEEWHTLMSVNVSGVFHTIKYTLPLMLERGKGAVVIVGSDNSVMAWQQMFPYTATKHALVGMVRSMALDYGPHGIRTNMVCPTTTGTEMVREYVSRHPDVVDGWLAGVPMRRMAEKSEVAAAICHLLSDEASFTNGLLYPVDGGLTAGRFTPVQS